MLHLEEQDVLDISALVNDFFTLDKEWNFALVNSFVPNDICNLINSIPIPSHNIKDSFCWGISRSGFFYH